MGEVTLCHRVGPPGWSEMYLQGYFAHKKTPTPLEPTQDPTHKPKVGS